MTNAQSKFMEVFVTCKDFQHPWNDSCVDASSGLLLAAIPYCIRCYSVVYALSLIMKHRIPTVKELKRTLLAILQSSAFLVTNSFTFILYNCLIRNIIGRYYYYTIAFIPSFISSWTAILVERPERRPLLTLYVANVATEAYWNAAKSRGWVKPIPHGQTIIFGLSIATLLYLFRLGLHKNSSCKDSIFNIIRIFVGKTEEGPLTRTVKSTVENEQPSTSHNSRSRTPIRFRRISDMVQIYSRIIEILKRKHDSCRHEEPCATYALIGGLKPFMGGVTLSLALKTFMNFKKIFKGQLNWKKTFMNRNTLQLGLFLGSFSFLYKSTSCILRHSFGRDDPIFAIPAGLIAGVSFSEYADITVALYVMWKTLQLIYNLGIEKGMLPKINGFTLFLYSFCTASLFHLGILEAQTIRPSYYRFLQAISGDRLSKFNMLPFDVYSTKPSVNMKTMLKKLNIVDKSIYPKCAMVW